MQAGDVVQLKSGGPQMTISHKAAGGASGWVCIWFDGAKKEQAIFPENALKPASEAGGRVSLV